MIFYRFRRVDIDYAYKVDASIVGMFMDFFMIKIVFVFINYYNVACLNSCTVVFNDFEDNFVDNFVDCFACSSVDNFVEDFADNYVALIIYHYDLNY